MYFADFFIDHNTTAKNRNTRSQQTEKHGQLLK